MTDLDRAKRWIEWSNKELKIRELPKLHNEATWEDYLKQLVTRKYIFLTRDNSIEVIDGVDRRQETGMKRSFSELYAIMRWVCNQKSIKLPLFSEFCNHINLLYLYSYCQNVRRHVVLAYGGTSSTFWEYRCRHIGRTIKKIKEIEDE